MPDLKHVKEIAEAGFKQLREQNALITADVKTLQAKVDEKIDVKGMVESGDFRDFVDAQVAIQSKALAEELITRMDSFEAMAKRGISHGDVSAKSLGEIVYANEKWTAAVGAWKNDRTPPRCSIDVPEVGYLMRNRSGYDFKDVLGATQLGPLLRPQERAEIVVTPLERSDFMAFVPRISAAGLAAYEYVRENNETKRGYIHTQLNGALLAAATTLVVDETANFITGAPGRIELDVGTKTTFLRVASSTTFTMHPTAQDAIDNTAGEALGGDAADNRLVVSDHYTTTAEATKKPEGVVAFTRVTDQFKTLASIIPVTQQQLDSAARVQALIERRLRTGWRRTVNHGFIYGNPVTDALQLQGFDTFAGAQTLLWSTGVTADTRADAVMRAFDLILTEGTATLHLNKRDWTKLVTEKATDGHYVHTKMGPMMVSQVGAQMMLGMFVVNTDAAIRLGDFFLIDHAEASEWPDKEDGKLQVGMINDDFEKNIARLRFEQSLAHSILATEAFVNAAWDSKPA